MAEMADPVADDKAASPLGSVLCVHKYPRSAPDAAMRVGMDVAGSADEAVAAALLLRTLVSERRSCGHKCDKNISKLLHSSASEKAPVKSQATRNSREACSSGSSAALCR